MTKQTARLENWRIGPDGMLYGNVYGHPNFEDGFPVRTSKPIKIETLNTTYELGESYQSLLAKHLLQNAGDGGRFT